jgi:hypothetical protein
VRERCQEISSLQREDDDGMRSRLPKKNPKCWVSICVVEEDLLREEMTDQLQETGREQNPGCKIPIREVLEDDALILHWIRHSSHGLDAVDDAVDDDKDGDDGVDGERMEREMRKSRKRMQGRSDDHLRMK